MAIPKGFRHKIWEITGFSPDLGDCHGRLRLPRNDRNVLRSPSNGTLNYNLIHKMAIDYLEKCGMIIMYRYASNYDA